MRRSNQTHTQRLRMYYSVTTAVWAQLRDANSAESKTKCIDKLPLARYLVLSTELH